MDPPSGQPTHNIAPESAPEDETPTSETPMTENVQPQTKAQKPGGAGKPSSPKKDAKNEENTSKAPDSQNLTTIDVAELTAQIMEMISKEDDESTMNQTGLLKKNVELQEFLVKLIELLREKTNLCANLERQNSALTNQAKSLRNVINITKDLLNIRNMEVEHLHVDMGAMEKSIKEERERHNMAVQRLSEAMTLNNKLKTEYLNQMEMFGKLRDKYNEKVAILMKENKNLKELMKECAPVNHVPPPESASVNPIPPPESAAVHPIPPPPETTSVVPTEDQK